MAPHIQQAIEHSLQVDLSSVRVHSDNAANDRAAHLSARAFTFGPDIYLGRGEHAANLSLLAHEATHVVQQQSHTGTQLWPSTSTYDSASHLEREAHSAASAVQAGQPFAVQHRLRVPQAQRYGLADLPGAGTVLNFFADAANMIPGFRMFTIVLGMNPVNGAAVDPSAANVLRALVEFIPGGGLITQALDKYSIFDTVGAWVSQQIKTLHLIGSSIKTALLDFITNASATDILQPSVLWDKAKSVLIRPIDLIKSFAAGLLESIWKFVRDAVLKPIAALAESAAAWPLLCAVLGKNPITGDKVDGSPEAVIGGFMTLIHEEEIWNNIKKANAISRAWAWFQGALGGLKGFVAEIPGRFKDLLHSLEWTDVINLPSGFRKVATAFGSFAVRFISWAGTTIWDLLQIIFEVVAPAVIPYIKRAGASFKSILKNPMGFVRNLVAAAKAGFMNFGANIGAHLKAGLLDWLTGSLPGVYVPKAFSLLEFGKMAISVLGLSWARIRGKIVKALGANGERIMSGLETTFDVVVALVTGGPAAAWEVIKDKLTNLKDMVVEGIVNFVVTTIVSKAVPKLIAMFVPGAGFISAILSIYETVMVFVQKLSKIAATVKAFVDSIMDIASGQIGGAAAKVEGALAGLLSLSISFLAGFLGLGNVASKIMAVIEKVRGIVDKALDTAINWIVGKAKALIGKMGSKEDPQQKLDSAMSAAESVVAKFSGKRVGALVLRPLLFAIKLRYGLQSLEVIPDGQKWAIVGTINPRKKTATDALTDEDDGDGYTEQELVEMLLGDVSVVQGPQPGMTDTKTRKDQQVTVPAVPETSISPSSLALSEEILFFYIHTSTAPQERKTSVSTGVGEKIEAARTSTDSHEIYKALQQAGAMVNRLYPAEKVVVVHHEQRVHDHPASYPRTKLEREGIPEGIKTKMVKSASEIAKKYQKDESLSKTQKRVLAKKDVAELTLLIKASLLDWRKSHVKNESPDKEPGDLKMETLTTSTTEPLLDEIDLIAGSRRAHIVLHQMEKKK